MIELPHPRIPQQAAPRAFSLIEIVLAVGIISIALLAIFGMFSVSLRSSAETLSQHEVTGITRSLNDFLSSPRYGAGFASISNWLSGGGIPGSSHSPQRMGPLRTG